MPMMNLIAILLMLAIGYLWLTRGFLSSLLNLVCVLIAGAIAFGFWEKSSHLLLASAPDFVKPMAWGLGLALPFAIALALLRAMTDAVIRANAKLQPPIDMAFGGLCGILSGVIVSGITVISIGNLHLEQSSLGHKPLDYSASGNVKRDQNLWVPTDAWTAALYETFSRTSLSTAQPLAELFPAAHEFGPANRMNYAEGRARNVFSPGDFDFLSRYTVGAGGKVPLNQLLTDMWEPSPQQVTDISGDPVTGPARIEGFLVNFRASANEKFGQVVVGPSQARLIVRDTQTGRTKPAHPIAVISRRAITQQSGNQQQGAAQERIEMARFRFDARDTFLATVGGGTDQRWALEFLVPEGWEPIALFLKGVRVNVDPSRKPADEFADAAARDAAIASGALMGAPGARPPSGVNFAGPPPPSDANFDRSGAVTVGNGRPLPEGQNPDGFIETTSLPFTIQKGQQRSLELAPDSNIIQGGQAVFSKEEMQNRGVDPKLRVDKLLTTPDTTIVQLEVGLNQAASWLNNAGAFTEAVNNAPTLYDTNNVAYVAVGYIYQDSTKIAVRYTPGRTLANVLAPDELPASLSRSRPDQSLRLIFRVTAGVQIREFALGNKTVAYYDPPIPIRGGR